MDISIDTLASQQNALFGLDDNGLRGLSTHPRRVKITRVAIDIASVIADRRATNWARRCRQEGCELLNVVKQLRIGSGTTWLRKKRAYRLCLP